MRVLVAMSGGVDSSVVAGLMVEAGHEVIGLTMKLRDVTAEERAGRVASCCTPDDVMDARGVCDLLGIPHYTVDYREAFRREVMEPFARAWVDGRTPNPCVLCNDHLKFSALVARAEALGADRLATGHYARVWTDDTGAHLGVAADARKDQSYFLFGIPAANLPRLDFPLGDMDKTTVRAHARRLGLPIWDKPDSEDICFVPGGDHATVVEEILGETPRAGRIVDEHGAELGRHAGIHRFTVGQRKGLGVTRGEPLYVLNVDGASGDVRVGPHALLVVDGLRAERCNWLSGCPPAGATDRAGVAVSARIRYRHPGADARLWMRGETALVRFDTPVPAVTPGQAVVFYTGGEVLGGGWITTALPDWAAQGEELHGVRAD